MRKRRKFTLSVVLVVVATGALVACSETKTTHRESRVERRINYLKDGVHVITSEVEDEPVTLRMTYSTAYRGSAWRVTDNKTLKFRVELVSGPENEQVFIEHVHVDLDTQSHRAIADGLKHDTMDDSIHGGDQPGFLISREHPYVEVFSIDGFSEELVDSWNSRAGRRGKRLTEHNLRNLKVFAEQFRFVYDVVVGTRDGGFHKGVVQHVFRVPLRGK